jgi:hypothetical protein
MISPSYLLQILLPEETGSGQPNPADMFEGVLQELTTSLAARPACCTSPVRAYGGGEVERQYCCDPGHD